MCVLEECILTHTLCSPSGSQPAGARRPADRADMPGDHSDVTDDQDEALQAAIQRSMTDAEPPSESQENIERPPPYNPHYDHANAEVGAQEQHIGFDSVHEQVESAPPSSGSHGDQGPVGFEAIQDGPSTSSNASLGFEAVQNEQMDEMGRSSLRQRHPQGGEERSLDDLRAARLARLNNVRQH